MKNIIALLIIAFVIFSGCTEKAETAIKSDEAKVPIREETLYGGYSPMIGATTNFYSLAPDGSKDTLLGTTTTDNDGFYYVKLSPEQGTSLLVELSGGSYVDKARGTNVTLSDSDKLSAVFNIYTTETTKIEVSPLTHMAAARALAQAKDGVPLDTAISAANIGVEQQYNLDDIRGWTPVNPSNQDEVAEALMERRTYGLVLAGIDQQAKTMGVRAIDLSAALADDMTDGFLDGKMGDSPIEIKTLSGGSVTMAASTGTADVQSAINNYMASPSNKVKIAAVSIPLHAVPVGINGASLFYTTTTVLPAAMSGQYYLAPALEARGGTRQYNWTVKAGSSLPFGLSLAKNGVISGTAPVLTGTTLKITPPFTVTVTDSAGQKQDLELRITIDIPPPTLTLKSGKCSVGKYCSIPLIAQVSGGDPPYYYKSDTFMSGTPPLGMIVNSRGNLVGTPKKEDESKFGVCVIDLGGRSSCKQTTVFVEDTTTTPQPTIITPRYTTPQPTYQPPSNLPQGFPTNLPTGTYSLTMRMCFPGYGCTDNYLGTISNIDIYEFSKDLTTALNQAASQCGGSGSSCRVRYSAFNGKSFTATYTITVCSGGSCDSSTIDFIISKV
ncbi:MAG: hypothetical protein OIN85_00145 [Candidatus Methanoperedens sp.]|nr:hypothetical protein [Candidatus Methanoperedens sp.]